MPLDKNEVCVKGKLLLSVFWKLGTFPVFPDLRLGNVPDVPISPVLEYGWASCDPSRRCTVHEGATWHPVPERAVQKAAR